MDGLFGQGGGVAGGSGPTLEDMLLSDSRLLRAFLATDVKTRLDEYGRSIHERVPRNSIEDIRAAYGALNDRNRVRAAAMGGLLNQPGPVGTQASMVSLLDWLPVAGGVTGAEDVYQAGRAFGPALARGDYGEAAAEGGIAALGLGGAALSSLPFAGGLMRLAREGTTGARDVGRAVAERLNQPGPMPTLYSNPVPGLLAEGGGAGQRLYRVEREIYENPGEGAVYYSPDRQYVENYNSPDRVLRQASIPENIIDTTTQGGRASVRSWLKSELGRYKQRAESGEIRGGPDLRDLDRILAKDELSFEEASRALALLDVLDSSAIGRIPVGASQRRFMEDVGVDAMTVRESDGSLSYAFRSPETARSYQISVADVESALAAQPAQQPAPRGLFGEQ